MNRIPLELKSLATIDFGKIQAAWEKHIRRIGEDLVDRPHDETARKIMLEMTFKPVSDGHDCTEVITDVQIKSKVPVLRSKPYRFAINKHGHLSYNPESLDDINQTTFADLEDAANAAPPPDHERK